MTLTSFEKPNSAKRINQYHLAGVRHGTKHEAYTVTNVLKQGVCRFVFTSTSRHHCPRTPEIPTQRIGQNERKQKAPNPHHLMAFSGELAVTTLKSETKTLHDEKAPTLDLPTVEYSKKKKSEHLQRIRVPLCFINFHLLLTVSCGKAFKILGYSTYGQK